MGAGRKRSVQKKRDFVATFFPAHYYQAVAGLLTSSAAKKGDQQMSMSSFWIALACLGLMVPTANAGLTKIPGFCPLPLGAEPAAQSSKTQGGADEREEKQ